MMNNIIQGVIAGGGCDRVATLYLPTYLPTYLSKTIVQASITSTIACKWE